MRFVILFCLFATNLLADPVSVTHRYGVSVVSDTPQRIVSVGYHEQDFLYSLGIAPVGVHEWFGHRPYASWGWAESARKTVAATPEVQRGFDIDLEWVWQQKPDLIVATFAPLDQAIYEKLSRIAPVIGPPVGFPDWGAPWQEELRLIAKAVSRDQLAEQVIGQVQADLDTLETAYPRLSGREVAITYVNGNTLVGYGPNDGANRMMADLGMVIPAEYTDLAKSNGTIPVSLERIDIFNKDVTLWLSDPAGRALVEALPAYADDQNGLKARSVWATEEEIGAISFQSPLSIPWVAAQLAERLEGALKK